MDLNDLKQIVGPMDLQDLKEIVAIKQREEDASLVDAGAPSASGPEMEATSSGSLQADNLVEYPQPVENDDPVEPDRPISIPTNEMENQTTGETASAQSVTIPTVETKTVRELTREKLERAFLKSGNPNGHNVDDILNALEEKGWDIIAAIVKIAAHIGYEADVTFIDGYGDPTQGDRPLAQELFDDLCKLVLDAEQFDSDANLDGVAEVPQAKSSGRSKSVTPFSEGETKA